jgi:hypothetical protein
VGPALRALLLPPLQARLPPQRLLLLSQLLVLRLLVLC